MGSKDGSTWPPVHMEGENSVYGPLLRGRCFHHRRSQSAGKRRRVRVRRRPLPGCRMRVFCGYGAATDVQSCVLCAPVWLSVSGRVIFRRFILIVAALTRRTALSLFLCGGSYLLFFAYSAVGPQLPEFLHVPLDALYRFGFGGYLLQESYSWVFPYLWSDVWKPVLLGIGMILLEFFLFWRIWRRKAKA